MQVVVSFEKLRKYMNALGYNSVYQIANRLDIRSDTWNDLMEGRDVKLSTIKKIMKALNLKDFNLIMEIK